MNEDLAVIDPVLPLELEDLLSDVLLELVPNAATSEAEKLTFDATSLRSVASGSTTATPLPLPLPIIPELPFPAENKLLPQASSGKSPASSSAPVKATPLEAGRFGKEVSEEELKVLVDSRIPKCTKRNTNWGMSVWKEWCKARHIETPIEQMDSTTINHRMARFVQEARRRDGGEYPPGSLHGIVSAIQRHMRENGRPDVSFFDERRTEYDILRKSLDARMKDLTQRGVGIQKKQAQPITPEIKSILWEKGIFSRQTSRGLQNVIFWYTSKMFGLRAADEHRNLEASQFTIKRDENGERFLRFSGRSCKNFQGGLHQKKLAPKNLQIYADESRGDMCIVSIFELYMSLIPDDGPFYRRPVGDSPPRYSIQAVGINTLKNIVKKFCDQAGFQGQYSNHSGKVTCATELFRHNVDEQLIMQQTGHRSQDAVRVYKRPTTEHKKTVSDLLQPPHQKKRASINLQQQNNNLMQSSSSASSSPFKIQSSGNSTQNIFITINS